MTNDLFQNLVEKYKNCESYIDTGEIEANTVRKPSTFSTYFARPDLFCFEWKGTEGFWAVIKCRNGEVSCQTSFHETKIVKSISQATGLTGTASPFIYRMLMPEKENKDFDLQDYDTFSEIEKVTTGNGTIWIGADSFNGMNTESWLVDKSNLVILEREAIYGSTEYQAKINAANYFLDSDPDLAASLKIEADELKNTGTVYNMKYLEVKFDSMTGELKEEKFGS